MAVSTSARGMWRLHRNDHAVPTMRKCPDCGDSIRDREAARLGFCDHCRDFTGMCGAGRKIVCPDVMTTTTWHMPCTQLGTVAWEISTADDPRRTLLCETHDAQMRSGRIPWVKLAVPLLG
ncbi:MAG: hypothetical protein J2P28_05045 [Actinobacteria bacterium]|nr:hypothetical protein [Actinomycetota bacterium]MBO0834873.1 hypothetical protein [Actinomycetota bacterium]